MLLVKLFGHKFDYSVADTVDLILVLLLIYWFYKRIRGTLGINMFLGMLVIYGAYRMVRFFKLEVLTDLLGHFVSAGVIVIIIVFQPEIRKFLLSLGNVNVLDRYKIFRKLPFNQKQRTRQQETLIKEINRAVENLSATKTGALMVFTDHVRLQDLPNPGVQLQSHISEKLLESIFNKNSPLHDGAVIIANHRIIYAGSVLPVSESIELPERIGLRHRSAVGITENSDAISLVVSEESGNISFAYDGKLKQNISKEETLKLITNLIIGKGVTV